MGYNIRRSGRITITPPIDDLEWFVRRNFLTLDGTPVSADIKVIVEDMPVDGGMRHVYARRVVGIETNADGFSGYREEDQLDDIAKEFGTTHQFSGAIDAVMGEDGGDRWRLIVDGTDARIVRPYQVWPGDRCPCGHGTAPAR